MPAVDATAEAALDAAPLNLPELPDPHAAAGLTEYLINGVSTFSRSDGAVDSGTALELDGGPGGWAWGVWAFSAGDNSLDSLALLVDVPEGTEYWLALADYSKGRWSLDGPYAKGLTMPILSEKHLSPAGQLYIALIAAGGATTTVQALSVRTINPDNQPPVADLTFPDGAHIGLVPLSVPFDASASTDSDGEISHYLWDVDNDGAYDLVSHLPYLDYVYETGGLQKMTVSVVDDQGAHDEEDENVLPNELPVIIVTADRLRAGKGEAITFDVLQSFDPDGFLTDIQWDLNGDGLFSDSPEELEAYNTFFVTLFWDSAGVRTVSAMRGDSSGFSGTGSLNVTVTGWGGAQTLDEEGSTGLFSSLVIVNGLPAIAYYDGDAQTLRYVRADIADGSTWLEPLTVDSGTPTGSDICLRVINGFPAISYRANAGLGYVRALDMFGDAWDEIETVDAGTGKGVNTSMVVVEGRPAISYHAADAEDLWYVRAADGTGSEWQSPVLLESDGVTGLYTSLEVVDGRPAISYYKQGGGGVGDFDLKYIRASDASGSLWPAGQVVDSAGDVGAYTSLALVNGRPAISFHDSSNETLKYVRALDASGADWGSAQSLPLIDFGGDYSSLAVIGGRPMISFRQGSTAQLGFVEALDQNGDSWATPDYIDSNGNPGHYSSLVELEGQPAIAYQVGATGDLRFIRRY